MPAAQVLTIKEGLPVAQAATQYAGQLLALPASVLPRTADALPAIDCVLLGVGPDGHVASLFPNRKETAATGACGGLLRLLCASCAGPAACAAAAGAGGDCCDGGAPVCQ